MYGPLKISQHKHSGRLRPHEHTSYVPLACLVLLVGVLLAISSVSTFAASPPPESNSVSLTGTVPAAPPKTAATINSPANGQHFTTSPVTISGTCPPGSLVEIYKNDIFAGSSLCSTKGTYSLQVDLLYGQNSITAQVYDDLNQAGPVSKTVTIFYDAVPPSGAPLGLLNFSGTQLVLDTNAVYRGSFPGQILNVPVTIIGGAEPFAVSVAWGDSSNQIIPRGNNTVFNASHTYQKAGTYQITLQATDSQQRVAFLTVAAIVNGQPSAVLTAANGGNGSGGSKSSTANKLLMLWPMYAIVATLVVSFWMGERREKHVLALATAIQPPGPPIGTIPHAQV